MTKKKTWGDKTVLAAIPNPCKDTYEIQIECPEITFMGDADQPDFGHAKITFFPGKKVIELKSLKKYFYTFRSIRMSYERFINVVYEDLMEVYQPEQLMIEVEFRPRGGLWSTVRADSKMRKE